MLTTITVTSLADGALGDLAGDGQISLREAIHAANTDSSVDGSPAGSGLDTIQFAPGLSGVISNTTGNLHIDDDLNIIGPGADVLAYETNFMFEAFINNFATVEVSGLKIQNSAPIFNGGDMTLSDMVFEGNRGSRPSGAIANFTTGTLFVSNSTFAHNSSAVNGGVTENLGVATFVNTTFSGNQSGSGLAGAGGAIVTYGDLTLLNSTFANNFAGGGGAAIHGAAGTVTFGNTVFDGNTANFSNVSVDGIATFNSLGNNLFSDSPAITLDASDITDTDALLGPLQDNGGTTTTHAPAANSPLLNAGSNILAAGLTSDQIGQNRFFGGTVDIGSFELQRDPNQPPTTPVDADANDNTVIELSATGTAVGLTAKSTDPEGEAVVYSLTDDAGGRFQIDSSTGVVTVNNESLLTPGIYTVVVQAADSFAATGTANFEIEVTEILNDAPTLIAANSSNPTLETKSSDGNITILGSFADEVTDSHVVTVDWGDGSAAENLISVDQANDTFEGAYQFAAGGIYEITITVTDSFGETVTETVGAVVTGVGLVNRTLYVIGTEGRDKVRLNNAGNNQVEVRTRLNQGAWQSEQFDANDIDSVSIIVCGANDHVKVQSNLNLSTDIQGGAGNDTIHGGAGSDRIDGGEGNDWIDSGAGNDIVLTGNGNNVVWAGAGDDTVIAGNGHDWLLGGSGNDVISGGAGCDWIAGGSGNDLLIGGLGSDVLLGQSGNDLLIADSATNETDELKLQDALADWVADDLAGALVDVGPLTDDGVYDFLYGGWGDDEKIWA